MPFFSVIVPVYNAEQTLERCVESVLAQTFSDWELVLVDDGSLDNSGAMCDAYALGSSRVIVHHQENSGVSIARNSGIEKATGLYILFADSDDYCDEKAFEHYYYAIQRNHADIVIAGYKRFEGTTEKDIIPQNERYTVSELAEHICIDASLYGFLWNKAFRTSLIKDKSVCFNPNYYSQEDLDFFISCMQHVKYVETISEIVYIYEYAPGKRFPPVWDFIANQMKLKTVAEQVAVISPKAKKAIEERVVRLLFSCLHSAVEHNRYDEAWDHLMAVSGLRTYMYTTQEKGEMYRIARWFAAERYYRILQYFKWRIRLRKLTGRG